jgi:hypothetical protein
MAGFLDDDVLKETEIRRLLDAETEGIVPAERCPWRRLVLCYSKIAFAVVVRSDNACPSDAERDQAKTTLYRYLKRIHLTLLESGLVYPLTCIAIADEGTSAHEEMKRWTSDQDWHRGDFTLYVEKDDDRARKRLLDLLSPRVEKLMAERAEPHDIGWYSEKLRTALPQDGPETDLGNIILGVWKEYAEQGRKYEDKDAVDIKQRLESWIDSRLADARRMAEGRA